MSKVIFDVSMSLDGYIAGPNLSATNPMGEGGERLHNWLFKNKTEEDTHVINELLATSGAVIVGGKTYDIAINYGWAGVTPFQIPAFIVTRNIPTNMVYGFRYVTTGIESALSQAKIVAGDKNVWIMGGATIAQRYLKAGLIDEIHIHLIPVILNGGTRLFEDTGNEQIELEKIGLTQSFAATHYKYKVLK